MIYGKPSIPLRLMVILPFYSTDRFVQAEVFLPGTVSGGEISLGTVSMSHQADGRYSALYTPPENYDFLDIVYKVYEDAGFTTVDTAYAPMHDQIVLHGFSSGGFGPLGLGGGAVKPLDDEDYDNIALRVWEMNINKINGKNTAAYFVKTQSRIILSEFKNQFSVIKNNLDIMFEKFSKIINDSFYGKESMDKNLNSVVVAMTDIKKMETLENNINQSLFALEFMALIDHKISDLLLHNKNPDIKTFTDYFDKTSKSNRSLSQEQTKHITGFLKVRTQEIISELENTSIKKIVDSLTKSISESFSKNSDEAKKLKTLVKDLNNKIKNNESGFIDVKTDYRIRTQEIIKTLQDNALVLAKMIKQSGKDSSIDFSELTTNLNKIQKNIKRYDS